MMPVYPVSHVSIPDWTMITSVKLSHTGWVEPCSIAAQAQCCCDGNSLWVRMEAREAPIRATLTGRLDQICDDSCLEFFFAPQSDDARYFNFECNPLGNLYVGFGAERPTRVRQIVKDPEALFQPAPFLTVEGWGVVFRVPMSFISIYFPGYIFSGEAACNFYKCGDKTEVPHFLAWSPLTCSTPDFHRRQDFGRLQFH